MSILSVFVWFYDPPEPETSPLTEYTPELYDALNEAAYFDFSSLLVACYFIITSNLHPFFDPAI